MEEFKLYSVSDDYVEWLRKDFPNVYSNKINSRTHTRKYLGVVLQIGQYWLLPDESTHSYAAGSL